MSGHSYDQAGNGPFEAKPLADICRENGFREVRSYNANRPNPIVVITGDDAPDAEQASRLIHAISHHAQVFVDGTLGPHYIAGLCMPSWNQPELWEEPNVVADANRLIDQWTHYNDKLGKFEAGGSDGDLHARTQQPTGRDRLFARLFAGAGFGNSEQRRIDRGVRELRRQLRIVEVQMAELDTKRVERLIHIMTSSYAIDSSLDRCTIVLAPSLWVNDQRFVDAMIRAHVAYVAVMSNAPQPEQLGDE